MARESVHAERQERSDEIKTPRNQGHSLSSSSAHEELDVQRERERERERERGRAGCEAPREILFHLRRAGHRWPRYSAAPCRLGRNSADVSQPSKSDRKRLRGRLKEHQVGVRARGGLRHRPALPARLVRTHPPSLPPCPRCTAHTLSASPSADSRPARERFAEDPDLRDSRSSVTRDLAGEGATRRGLHPQGATVGAHESQRSRTQRRTSALQRPVAA